MAREKRLRDYLQRGPTHEIDEAAQNILKPLLPTHWVVNELKRDYGKDYHVEITEKDTGKVTGEIFYIQLKGTDKAAYRYGGASIAQPMQLRHLAYFCDEVKMPVFLVVVDTKTRKAYWTYVQKQLTDRKDWRRRKKTTLQIPVTNDLSDFAKFEVEVHDAIRQMRAAAVSLQDKIAFDIARLEAKDARFKIFLHAEKGVAGYGFRPLEDVNVTFRFKGSDPTLPERVKSLIDRGKVACFGPGEVEIQGSPLFEEFNEAGGMLQMASRADVTLKLICLDENDGELGQQLDVPGIIEGGSKERRFRSSLTDSPFKIQFWLVAPGTGTIRFQTDLSVWEGQRLLWISYFEPMFSFFKMFSQHMKCRGDCFWQGNPILEGLVGFDEMPGIDDLIDCLTMIDKARKVARHFAIDPPYRGGDFYNDETIGQIETLYDIMTEGRHDLGISWNIDVTVKKGAAAKIGELEHGLNLVLFTADDFCLPFLGQQVHVGRLAIEASHATLAISPEELKHRLAGADEEIKLPCSCSEGNPCFLRCLSEEERKKQETILRE